MAKVYALDGIVPVVDPSAFVHPDAVLIGDIIVGPNCYVGPCAVLRGDFGRIRLAAGANVQDGCVIHSNVGVEVLVDVDGHIGHGAVIHGCRIGRNALVGMNAVVMDDVVVGDNAFIAASAFVPKGMQVPAGVLVAGVPARGVRGLSDAEIASKAGGTRLYQQLARRSLATMVAVTPLASEAERG
ncbi:phenylacetic acid degradation protein PaaY [Crenobacter sp. SG2305]|uniref:phenylacetic acid degradation protein PaaY n=1 Tax=Crenobacter oryzisoli TaxID=3056844 RepID=UPI0025AAA4FD|nr:phenylacetic acid degradation protein PaaY [Crenobacter sp. SG2305]MDN0085497.1 phenylacetic acid degradation protein PaaY [Crenobacter sp. SG2305]